MRAQQPVGLTGGPFSESPSSLGSFLLLLLFLFLLLLLLLFLLLLCPPSRFSPQIYYQRLMK